MPLPLPMSMIKTSGGLNIHILEDQRIWELIKNHQISRRFQNKQ